MYELGGVPQWLTGHDWKSCGRKPTRVRIPPPPQRKKLHSNFNVAGTLNVIFAKQINVLASRLDQT